jgi:hypothetical protein
MTRPKFGLKASQFRGCTIREKMREQGKWSTQGSVRFGGTGAVANARHPYSKSTEKRVENPRPVVMNGSLLVAAGAAPAFLRCLLDLIEKERLLQLPEQRPSIL